MYVTEFYVRVCHTDWLDMNSLHTVPMYFRPLIK